MLITKIRQNIYAFALKLQLHHNENLKKKTVNIFAYSPKNNEYLLCV